MKRKFIILIFSFVLFFSSYVIKAYAATWEFRWTNTTIDIPVGGNLSDYAILPEARLYKDSMLLTDAKINYLREGDFLYFMSNVNTSKIGVYKVLYKASETEKYKPGTCNGYKAIITFNVRDLIPPTISMASDNIFVLRKASITKEERELELENIKKNIVAKDNYSDCDIKLNENINFLETGTYDVIATAYDSSGNHSEVPFQITVYDSNAPVITFLGSSDILRLPLNGNINIRDYFTARDEIDGDLTYTINYPPLDLSEVKSYDYSVSVSNKSGKETIKTIRVEVVDDIPPTLTLSTHNLVLDYKTDFENYNFFGKVRINDNQPINYDNLSITYDIENVVGNYTVWYSYNDGVYTVEDKISVKCVSKERPVLTVDDIVIKKNSNVSLKSFITATDESDPLVQENIQIDDSNVNYKKSGTYYADVYVANSSGLSSQERIKVVIKSDNILNGINIPLLILVILLGLATIGYIGFFIYYFVIKKRKENQQEA